jgi:hypothetical protein
VLLLVDHIQVLVAAEATSVEEAEAKLADLTYNLPVEAQGTLIAL